MMIYLYAQNLIAGSKQRYVFFLDHSIGQRSSGRINACCPSPGVSSMPSDPPRIVL